ncbi:AEC family transporter [Nitrincola sp. MINF-07-Sa-05]|uniref:AEC family transporter n=1 Tax=Nitrincola salilacus TaxID=3400273 RepID=UPI0039181CCB
MLMIVTPIFMVILLGYVFGKVKPDSGNSDKLINDYVLYVALPALLFLAIARADINELKQWGFIGSTLAGIVSAYLIAGVIARIKGIRLPQSSILSMGASYGTTGYMGVPILISVYGQEAALPAAIATVLHNIPAIMAVIISWDLSAHKGKNESISTLRSLGKASKTTFTNPLTISVLAGLTFVLSGIKTPVFLEAFANFLGNAAGPTALFALGLGLSRLSIKEHISGETIKMTIPMIFLKIFIQPMITFLIAIYIFGMGEGNKIWLAAAVVMAAQPIGAGVYVFAKKYGYREDTISLAIIVSLAVALVTIPALLSII